MILTKLVLVDPLKIPELKVLTPETDNCVTDAIPPITLVEVAANDMTDCGFHAGGKSFPLDTKISPALPEYKFLVIVNVTVLRPTDLVCWGEI